MGNKIPRSCRIEYIILLWDLMRAMGILALEGKRFSSADGRWIPWGGPRGNGCWTNRPTRENSLPQTVGTSPTQAISRIRNDVAPGFCYSGLTPHFEKGNRLSGTLRGRVTKFSKARNQAHIRLPRLNELHVSIVCKTKLGTQCPMEPYQHVSLSYFRLVVLESTLAI